MQNQIRHQKTTSYLPAQNGVAKRANKTIIKEILALLFDAKLYKAYWSKACNTSSIKTI